MRVGWIGLGQMGEPMALRVLGAGHSLVGHSRGGRPREALTAAGGRITGSLAEAVAQAEVVCACLFDDVQTQEALIESGALQAMAPGSVLAVHTTGSPTFIEGLAAAAPPQVSVLDATFSGTDDNARRGDVRLFVGGEAGALEQARPVLAAYCDPILHLGPVGAGRRLKLINNLLFGAQVSLAMEALDALERMGLPRGPSVEALRISSGGSAALGIFPQGRTEPVLARLSHYLDKDVDLARRAAREEGLDLRLLLAATAQWGGPAES